MSPDDLAQVRAIDLLFLQCAGVLGMFFSLGYVLRPFLQALETQETHPAFVEQDDMLKYFHSHPINIVGVLTAVGATVINIVTNPVTGTVLSNLPQSRTVNILAAVVAGLAAFAAAYKKPVQPSNGVVTNVNK